MRGDISRCCNKLLPIDHTRYHTGKENTFPIFHICITNLSNTRALHYPFDGANVDCIDGATDRVVL